jgi:hypothetical protein
MPPCRAGATRAISASTNTALTAISVSVVVASGVIGVAPTRIANEIAAVTSAPAIATTPGSASNRRPSLPPGLLKSGSFDVRACEAMSPSKSQ